MSEHDCLGDHFKEKIKSLEAERDKIISLLATERDSFGKKEIELMGEIDSLKAELETLKSTTPRGLYESRDLWKSRAEKLADQLRIISNGAGPFSRDPLTHASNTIEEMKRLAREALEEYLK